ncbi:CHAT domain-containing protein [Argonema antarcticum]|uniref:CHAT domain-containing protein n=1 Tax=Argonema antarcticum TaxID=2942763 RepID=UPI0020118F28|nr:CHAT domain-containing protein [Argonema antarcticum]MCL1473755.1 CHAT domain-containing protein [Argonema antarcticum A004/B2]
MNEQPKSTSYNINFSGNNSGQFAVGEGINQTSTIGVIAKPDVNEGIVNKGEIKRKILILAANPKGTTPVRLGEEVREIDESLQQAKNRDRFILVQKWAVRPGDIQQAMLEHNPQIVHFSGHGTGDDGLVFEDETGQAKLVDGEALAGLFKLFADQLDCVVLNGCYSEVQAKAIAKYINYVVGMNRAIGDKAAIKFAEGFYKALGDGQTVEVAYQHGCVAIRLAGISEELTPVLNLITKPQNQVLP